MAQWTDRRHVELFDQHDREWGAVIEIRTGHSVGPINPVSFRAPLLPPQKFIRHAANSPFKIEIDYDGWARESMDAMAEYESRRRKAALAISAQGTVTEVLKNDPPELRDIVGPPPDVAPVIAIQAAKAGNPWVLRFEGDPPKAALALDYFAKYRDEEVAKRKLRVDRNEPLLPLADPFAEPKKSNASKSRETA